MALRITETNEPVFVDYFASHEIRDPDEPDSSSDNEEAHSDPQPQPQPRSHPAPTKSKAKSSKRKATSVDPVESPKSKRVNKLASKPITEKKSKKRKSVKPLSPPTTESADSDRTPSGNDGGDERESTRIEVDPERTEHARTSKSTKFMPGSGSQSTGPNAPSAGGTTKITTHDKPSGGESGEGPTEDQTGFSMRS